VGIEIARSTLTPLGLPSPGLNSTIIPLVREVFVFRPPRRLGLIINGIAVLLLAAGGAFGLWRASQAVTGPIFLIYLLSALVAIALAPTFIYRMVALQRARYILERDGISLYWGLRREEIPLNMITWVGLAEQLETTLPKPLPRWPGAILGLRTQADGKPVEFLAARDDRLVLIVTLERTFAISPADEADFLRAFRRLSEFGSLSPIQAASVYPTFLLSRSWADRPARILLALSALLSLGLIVWVSLATPTHPQISLRLTADGSPIEFVPGIRLLLLPVLNTFFFIADLLLGLFFYRRADTQSLAYLMWASSVVTTLLFSGAVYFILRAT
jgi:Bacterial PH domain